MKHRVPRRPTVVWLGLVVATMLTVFLGTDEPFGTQAARVAGALALAIAFAKIAFVGLDFMEVRDATTGVRRAFGAWVGVVGGTAVVLYLV